MQDKRVVLWWGPLSERAYLSIAILQESISLIP
jgi:hypothetical protein